MKVSRLLSRLLKPLDGEGGDLGGGGGGEQELTGSGFPAETMDYDPSKGIDLSGTFGEKSAQATPDPTKTPAVTAPAPPPASPAGTPAPPPNPDPTAGQPPSVPDTTVPPKSWKAEMHQHFATLPPNVQAYVHEREQQALKGIMGYKSVVDGFATIFKPYDQLMKANGLDPFVVTQRLAKNHHDLSTGTPEQKAQVAINLLKAYGIGPEHLIEGYEGKSAGNGEQPVKINLAELPEFTELSKTVKETQSALQGRLAQEAKAELDAFVKDPQNKYYKELENDIAELLESQAASTLAEAYEIAKWKNATVRPKALQDLRTAEAAELQKTADKAKKASKFSMSSTTVAAQPPKGSMEAGMKEIVAKHYGNQPS